MGRDAKERRKGAKDFWFLIFPADGGRGGFAGVFSR
jgi:hypothetical protein